MSNNRQKEVYNNKVEHGFNVTDVHMETRLLLQEVAEFMKAVEKNDKDNMLEELADVCIFCYGIAEITKCGNLDEAIDKKMLINRSRKYIINNEGDAVKIG